MAKKATKTVKRGGGTVEEQVEKLKEKVGPKGVALAQQLIKNDDGNPYTADILRLAVKMDTRKPARAGGLGSRIEGLLAGLSEDRAAEIRRELLAAKSKK